MNKITAFVLASILIMIGQPLAASENCPEVLNVTKKRLAEERQENLCENYLGKVILVVNTASKCGYTGQYEGLEKLYRDYKDRGLVVLGFPSNDFGNQEPGSEQQIASFCRLTYGVEFPMFEKSHVARDTADPLFKALAEQTGVYPQWNFHKYLIDRNGRVTEQFPSRVEPQSDKLIEAIEKLL